MSQPQGLQTSRTGYPIAAGVLTIISACLLIAWTAVTVWRDIVLVSLRSSQFFNLELPSLMVSILLGLLAVIAGAVTLTRKHLWFAVFGASVLFAPALHSVSTYIGLWSMQGVEYEIIPFVIWPVILALSALTLMFLALSSAEFT